MSLHSDPGPPTSPFPEGGSRIAISVIENRDHEILLLRRAASARLGAGKWGFPAGHIEADETSLACALRELDEEIGSSHRLELLRQAGPVRDSFYGGRFEIHLFHHRWIHGRIVLNPEHTGFAWAAAHNYRRFDVMDGIDEDLAWLDIWPRQMLNPDKLPPHLRHGAVP